MVKVMSHSNRKLKTTNGYYTYYPKSVALLSSSIPSLLPSVFIKLLYLQYLAENSQHPAVKICTIKSTDSKSTSGCQKFARLNPRILNRRTTKKGQWNTSA